MTQPRHSLSTSDFRIDVLDSADGVRAVGDRWDELWRRSDVTMPTVTAEPTALWLEAFARRHRTRILTVWQGKQLVGALPLVERKLGRVVPVGDLTLNDWSPNGELLLDQEADIEAVVDLLAEEVCRLPWPLVWLEMLPYGAARWTLLAEALRQRGTRIDTRPGFEIGRVSLGQSFDAYFAGRSKNLRRSVGKDFRRLEREGKVELALFDRLQPHEVEGALRRAFDLEDSGWKGRAGTSVLRSGDVFDFYRRQAELFARRGCLRLAFLECAGRAIAFELGWIGGRVYHSFKVGYDEGFRKFGPGHLLRYKLIEAGCGDGNLDFVDYQGPMTEALRPWATESYAIGRMAVCLPRLSSRSVWAVLQVARGLSGSLRHAASWLG